MVIPKIIHQVWEGRTKPNMPVHLQILARTWRQQNPDREYHLWSGEEMDELAFIHYPQYLPIYKSFPYHVQRRDTIRNMILYQYGGVYTDLDTECYYPIDRLLENREMCFGEEPPEHNIHPGVFRLVGNAFMASRKKDAGWLDILKEISSAVQRDYPIHTVLYTTGPIMLSKLFDSLKEEHGACHLPYQEVTPVTKVDMCEYIYEGKKELFHSKIKNACCAHYFFGSWYAGASFYI